MYELPNVQASWLIQDLEANTNKDWIIAYWHHPPFTKGSHDSDNPTTDGDLIQIRSNFIQILENYGVDLILGGHSHVYERTKLLKGYYGSSADFNETLYALNTSSGKYDATVNSCPYYKSEHTGNDGTLYVVTGSAGQRGGAGSIPGFPHNAMYYSNATEAGAMMLEVNGNRLDAKWVSQSGIIEDQFTMMKEVNRNTTYTTAVGSPVTLEASYIGSYVWTDAQTTSSVTVTPAEEGTSVYIVKDDKNCVADTFNVIASRILPLTWKSIKAWYNEAEAANVLTWETMNEVNVTAFDIERSADGIHFSKIGTVTAEGNIENHSYAFSDREILTAIQKYYYRIKQRDADGKFTYSSIVSIDRLGDANFDVQIVPNPGRQGQVRIKLISGKKRNVEYSIVNAVGKLIMSKKILVDKKSQSVLPNVQAGVYFVRIAYDGRVVTKKFIVE